MSNNNENKLVPRLRFPEFENSWEWDEKMLGEIADTKRIFYEDFRATPLFCGVCIFLGRLLCYAPLFKHLGRSPTILVE
jgi:hypothetical protein